MVAMTSWTRRITAAIALSILAVAVLLVPESRQGSGPEWTPGAKRDGEATGDAVPGDGPGGRGDGSAVKRGAGIRGRVLRAESDGPVSGARVVAFDFSTGDRSSVDTDELGWFALPEGLGTCHLLASKPGLASARVNRVRPSHDAITIRLEASGAIEGTVVGLPERLPVSGVEVVAVHRRFASSREFDRDRVLAWQALPSDFATTASATADGDGRFRLADLRPGKYVLLVTAPDHQPTFTNGGGRYYEYRGIEVRSGETTTDVLVTLLPAGRVIFRVTDAETGAPIAGVVIRAEVEVDDRKFMLPCPVRCPSTGRYEVPVGLNERGRVGGGYFLLVREGYSSRHMSFSGHENGSAFDVELAVEARVHGTVFGLHGRPLAGAVLFVRRDADRGLLAQVRTDVSGNYATGPLPARTKLELLCYGPDVDRALSILPIELAPAEDREIHIGATDRPALVGTVRHLGVPVPSAFLCLDGPGGRRTQVRARADGRYRFDGLTPGRHEIYVSFDTPKGRSVELERIVTVRPGVPTELNLDVNRAIRGHAVVERGASKLPADGVKIAARRVDVPDPDETPSAATDAKGGFEIHLSEPGIYELYCTFGDHVVLSSPRIDLTRTESVDDVRVVLLDDPQDGVIRIVVRNAATGDPVADGDWYRTLNYSWTRGSFENGRIEEDDAGIGTHRFSVWSDRHAPVRIEIPITRFATRAHRTIDLPLSDSVLVTRVEPGSRAAAAGLRTGDVILHHGKTPVRNVGELLDAVRTTKPADRVALTVLSDGVKRTLRIAGGRMGVGVENHRAGS